MEISQFEITEQEAQKVFKDELNHYMKTSRHLLTHEAKAYAKNSTRFFNVMGRFIVVLTGCNNEAYFLEVGANQCKSV